MALISMSGTITAGGVAQALLQAGDQHAPRNGFSVQNNSAGDLWINELGGSAAAGQPCIKIPAGALYETPRGMPCPQAVSIYGATTGQAFSARAW